MSGFDIDTGDWFIKPDGSGLVEVLSIYVDEGQPTVEYRDYSEGGNLHYDYTKSLNEFDMKLHHKELVPLHGEVP